MRQILDNTFVHYHDFISRLYHYPNLDIIYHFIFLYNKTNVEISVFARASNIKLFLHYNRYKIFTHNWFSLIQIGKNSLEAGIFFLSEPPTY